MVLLSLPGEAAEIIRGEDLSFSALYRCKRDEAEEKAPQSRTQSSLFKLAKDIANPPADHAGDILSYLSFHRVE